VDENLSTEADISESVQQSDDQLSDSNGDDDDDITAEPVSFLLLNSLLTAFTSSWNRKARRRMNLSKFLQTEGCSLWTAS